MQPNQTNKPEKKYRGLKRFAVLCFIVLGGVAIFRQQEIFDWWKLRDYQPPAQVSVLASDATMTDSARRLFYVYKPQVQDKTTFYKSCEENETTIILGCYKQNDAIYLLQVDDSRLEGVEQVTAAHELLHAAYGRLGGSERNRVTKLLNDYYETLDNEELRSKIAIYQKNDADITDELHSILGTEVAQLSPELETYYRKYFMDRTQVVTFAAAYKGVFTERKNKLQSYDAQLVDLENKVKVNNTELIRQQAIINAESDRLNALMQANNITEYNQGVAAYNRLLPPYRALASQTQKLIDQYTEILNARNQIALEAQQLNKALDSRLQTPSQTDI